MNHADAASKPPATPYGDGGAALEAAFTHWQSELLGTLFYLVGNAEDARDALQEAFVKCWQKRQQLEEIENLKAWIFRIALNTGRDMRASAWRRKRQMLEGSGEMIPTIDPGPVDALARVEELSQLRSALAELRPEEQEVFLLRQNGDFTYEQIAASLDVPTGTVKTRMRLALSKLRKALEVV
jgi:RNA polymerase sigma-70 factor (ECF subfamily)